MQESVFRIIAVGVLLFNLNVIHVEAQGIYSEDFITTSRCRTYACVADMMSQVGYSYDESTIYGVNETFICDKANEDGGHDLINFSIIDSEDSGYNQIIFATDRYYTYDALSSGLFGNAFKADSTSTNPAGAEQVIYFSQLYPGMAMITQVFPNSPEGNTKQYYITLQLLRNE